MSKPGVAEQSLIGQAFNALKKIKGWLECEHCREVLPDVKAHPAMTAYHWDKEKDGPGPDPNRDVVLCNECHEGYVAHWESMWAEYNAGRG